jgi:hypothetical protein
VVRRAAGFHADPTCWQRGEEGEKVAAPNFPRDDNLALAINGVDEEHMLGQVEANRGDRRQVDW